MYLQKVRYQRGRAGRNDDAANRVGDWLGSSSLTGAINRGNRHSLLTPNI